MHSSLNQGLIGNFGFVEVSGIVCVAISYRIEVKVDIGSVSNTFLEIFSLQNSLNDTQSALLKIHLALRFI